MKSVYLCLVVFCASFALVGCGETKETSLANDGVTDDAIAQYEAELAAISGDDAYEDAEGDEGDDAE